MIKITNTLVKDHVVLDKRTSVREMAINEFDAGLTRDLRQLIAKHNKECWWSQKIIETAVDCSKVDLRKDALGFVCEIAVRVSVIAGGGKLRHFTVLYTNA